MARKEAKGWSRIALDSWLLGAEAWTVVGLRTARLACGGPEACTEAQLMMTEKVDSGLYLCAAMLTGELGGTPKALVGNILTHYLAGVQGNRRRLSRD